MSRKSRDKGLRSERAIVHLFQDKGFAAEKTSRTGYTGHDLTVPVLGLDRRVEVKVRANGFQRLYDWLTSADLLIVRADRREPLVILPLKLAAEIAAKAEATRGAPSPAGGRSPFVPHPPIGDA
jgi:hypothetical protein